MVAAWLAGIIVNLLTVPGFYDVALRDFGLLLARAHAGAARARLRPAARMTADQTFVIVGAGLAGAKAARPCGRRASTGAWC